MTDNTLGFTCCSEILYVFNLIHTGLFGWCSTGGGGVFHLHPVTPLSFKSDNSNFEQNNFGVGSIV